jgi:hypothetical protein
MASVATRTLHEAMRCGLTIVKVWNIASLIAVVVVRRCRTQQTAPSTQHTFQRNTASLMRCRRKTSTRSLRLTLTARRDAAACLETAPTARRHVAAQQPHRELPLRILSHRLRLPRRRPHTRRVRRRAATRRQRHCSRCCDDEHRRMRARSPTHDVAAIVDTTTRRTLQLMSMSTKQGLDSSSGCITGAAGHTISRTPCSNAARHGHSASGSRSSTAVGQFVIEPVVSLCVGTTHSVTGESSFAMPRGVKRSRDAGANAV